MKHALQKVKFNKYCAVAAAVLCLLSLSACAGESTAVPPSSAASASQSESAPSSSAASAPQSESAPSSSDAEPQDISAKTEDNIDEAPQEESDAPDTSENLSSGLISGTSAAEALSQRQDNSSSPQNDDADTAASAAQSEPTAPAPAVTRATALTVRVPKASGVRESRSQSAVIDYSNTSEGYIMVKYTGNNPKVKLQITGPDKNTYTYTLQKNANDAFALTGGNGNYTANVLENIQGQSYALALTASFSAQLSSTLLPFLYPNQYVNFSAASQTVATGEELAKNCSTEIEVVQAVYNYVISNTSYDNAKVTAVVSGYVPKVDEILASKKGICFDYAALMAAMLRTQNIPTRMETGYTATGIFHAWISVYLTESGWVNGLISFDGKSWRMMDPTYASSSTDPNTFIPSASNYTVKYLY